MTEEQPDKPLIVVGLGNPGDKYKRTRHNIGFEVIDAIRSQVVNQTLTGPRPLGGPHLPLIPQQAVGDPTDLTASGGRPRLIPQQAVGDPTKLRHSVYSSIVLPQGRLMLVWPSTFMNLSGKAVVEVLDLFSATPDRLLVIVDDIAIPLGAIRTRPSGSDGGHNGLFSIAESIATQSFARIRLGVGPVPEGVDSADFVLARFSKQERETVEKIVQRAAEAVIFSLDHPLAEVMSKFNSNPVSAG
jgi:peptidyl-tRNA hydrolase, PTH1 family